MEGLLYRGMALSSHFFARRIEKKEDYALCECKVTPFLVGLQYPNVGIFLDLYGVFWHLRLSKIALLVPVGNESIPLSG